MIHGPEYQHKYSTIIEGVWNDMNMSTPLPEQQQEARTQQFIKVRDEIRWGTAENFEQWYQAYSQSPQPNKRKKRNVIN